MSNIHDPAAAVDRISAAGAAVAEPALEAVARAEWLVLGARAAAMKDQNTAVPP